MSKIVKPNLFNAELPYNGLLLLRPKENLESVSILKQVTKSAVALAELKGFSNTVPLSNPNILLNAIILIEARASSEIENIITTQDKLYQALSAKGIQVDNATKEVLRYREALLTGYAFIQKKGFISTNAILQIKKVLEENNAGIRKLPGTALRNASNGKVIYTPPDNHEVLLKLMANLEEYLNEDQEDISPLIKMAVQHYQFESIHPFYDGNGRTGRILNVLYLILHKQLDSPIIYLSDYIIQNKNDYYRLLQEVRTKDNWEEWILFILKGVEYTAKVTIEQIAQINQLFDKIQEKVRKSIPKVYIKDLIELLFEHPNFRIDRLKLS